MPGNSALARSRRRPAAFWWCSPTTTCGSGRRPARLLGSAADLVARAAKAERFTGKSGSALDIVAPAGLKATRLIVIGTGKAADRKPQDFVKLGGIAHGARSGRRDRGDGACWNSPTGR